MPATKKRPAKKAAKDPNRVKAGKKARRKGGTGENLASKYLAGLGYYDAERSLQHNGMLGQPDVVCVKTLPGLRIEVKYNYAKDVIDIGRKGLVDAVIKASSECKIGESFVILWTRLGSPTWFLTFYSDDPMVLTTVWGEDVPDSLEWIAENRLPRCVRSEAPLRFPELTERED